MHSSGFHAPSVTAEKCWPWRRTRDTGLNSAGDRKYETPRCGQDFSVFLVSPPHTTPHTLPPLSFTVHSTLSYHSCCWHRNVLGGWLASFHHRLRDSSRPNAWFNLNLGVVLICQLVAVVISCELIFFFFFHPVCNMWLGHFCFVYFHEGSWPQQRARIEG